MDAGETGVGSLMNGVFSRVEATDVPGVCA